MAAALGLAGVKRSRQEEEDLTWNGFKPPPSGGSSIFNLLQEKLVDLDKQEQAIKRIRRLVRKGEVDINETGGTILWDACWWLDIWDRVKGPEADRRFDVVNVLLELGADINIPNSGGRGKIQPGCLHKGETVLFVAAWRAKNTHGISGNGTKLRAENAGYNKLDAMIYLLDHGAELGTEVHEKKDKDVQCQVGLARVAIAQREKQSRPSPSEPASAQPALPLHPFFTTAVVTPGKSLTTQVPMSERVYVSSTFYQKEAVKALRGKWDPVRRLWWFQKGSDTGPFTCLPNVV